MKLKLILPAVIILFLLLVVGIYIKGKGSAKVETPEITEVESTLPLAERPYITLLPGADGHRASLTIDKIKDAKTIEYQIVYEAAAETGDLVERGIFADFIPVTGPSYTSGDKLFGSASSGKERLDKDVQGTQLIVRLKNDTTKVRYETEWRIYSGSKKIDFGDGKFVVEGNLSTKYSYILMQTVGIPKEINGEIIGGPYAVFTRSEEPVKATITIQTDVASPTARVFGWDSKSSDWKEITKNLKITDNKVSVETDTLTTFVVVK